VHRIFQITIFLSAFLLFQIQPIIGRYILPWFGGAAGVWSVMVVFFQFVLLAGYGYAHLLCTRMAPRVQLAVHLTVLGAALLALPVAPNDLLKPAAGSEPITGILAMLGVTVGLPYFAVSTTGPLVQAWFARTYPRESPYWLYALSNAGSLLALLTYPFLIEPMLGRNAQAMTWSLAFAVFAVLCAAAAMKSLWIGGWRMSAAGRREDGGQPPDRARYLAWIGLPALASALLLSFTNEICVDVASVPFLWVLPLGCYLLSFIFTFSGKGGLQKKIWNTLGVGAVTSTAAVMFWPGMLEIPIHFVVFGYAASLLILCCVLHGEVFRIRPEAQRITEFYFCVSIGGVLGGLFVGIVAPVIFNSHLELPVVLFFVFISLVYSSVKKFDFSNYRHSLPILIFGIFIIIKVYNYTSQFEYSSRNFYGVYRIQNVNFDKENGMRTLYSGTTLHGSQYTNPDYQSIPTQYFSRHSGVGIALASLDGGPKKVGVIGLGIGTLAAYGRPGDTYRFYEINPNSLRIAQERFSYLRSSRAHVQVVLGDARLNLEREETQRFDVLVLDAFTSDSIPMHLLTEEAFSCYLRHLAPEGGICVHISNRHLDLTPMLKSMGARMGLHAFKWSAAEDVNVSGGSNEYVVLTPSRKFIDRFDEMARFVRREFVPQGKSPDEFARRFDLEYVRETRFWTDDFSNLFDVLKPVFRKRG
jgi:spermidine synthase